MKFLPKIFFSSLILSLIILKIFYQKKIYIKNPSIDDEVSPVYIDNNNIKYRYYRKEL